MVRSTAKFSAGKQGGGTVVIPEGKWKSARIVLKSNVNLHLAKGAEIEFAGRAEDYLPAVFTRHEGWETVSYTHLDVYKRQTLDNLIYYNRTIGKHDFGFTFLQTATKYEYEANNMVLH